MTMPTIYHIHVYHLMSTAVYKVTERTRRTIVIFTGSPGVNNYIFVSNKIITYLAKLHLLVILQYYCRLNRDPFEKVMDMSE